jgi:hypothetical protein
MTEELIRNPYFVLSIDRPGRIVRYARTSLPYPSTEEVARSLKGIGTPARSYDPASVGLLVDLRDGPLRNEDDLESAIGHQRTRFFTNFAGVAVLVKTAVGALQMSRLNKQDRLPYEVFQDEAKALAHLRTFLRD